MPLVEISLGELIDKITILEIKRERLSDAGQLQNFQVELQVLSVALAKEVNLPPGVMDCRDRLKQANLALWDIEDDIRACERSGDFGDRFIQLARSVYLTNDQRSAIKREVNELVGSRLVEEKSYAPY